MEKNKKNKLKIEVELNVNDSFKSVVEAFKAFAESKKRMFGILDGKKVFLVGNPKIVKMGFLSDVKWNEDKKQWMVDNLDYNNSEIKSLRDDLNKSERENREIEHEFLKIESKAKEFENLANNRKLEIIELKVECWDLVRKNTVLIKTNDEYRKENESLKSNTNNIEKSNSI
jgi:hypothetical protein